MFLCSMKRFLIGNSFCFKFVSQRNKCVQRVLKNNERVQMFFLLLDFHISLLCQVLDNQFLSYLQTNNFFFFMIDYIYICVCVLLLILLFFLYIGIYFYFLFQFSSVIPSQTNNFFHNSLYLHICFTLICTLVFAFICYFSLVVPFLRFGEIITGGSHFPLTSDALKKVFTGQASHEVLISIAHAVGAIK